MAAEKTTSWGAAIPGQCGRVPAGDQVCTAEALTPAVQMVGGTLEAQRRAVAGCAPAALQAVWPRHLLPVVGALGLGGWLAEVVI